jgi:hypothetical protein
MAEFALTRWVAPGITRKFVVLNFLLFGLAIALTVLTIFAITIISGVRAYVAGEGLYAKYQKDSVFYLRRYVQTGNVPDYQRFSSAVLVPLGDGEARRALEKPSPDREDAERSFRAGRNAPEDVPSMVKLFLQFRHFAFVDKAIRIWGEADVLTNQLAELGRQAHSRVSTGAITQSERDLLIRGIDDLNERLVVLENNFSQTLSQGSRWISGVVFKALLLADLLLLVVGLVASTMLGRSVVNEIGEISAAVGRIAHGDLSARRTVEGSDEFVHLAQGVNQMAASIELAQRELKLARDNALQASRVKSEFLANMSHEIRTPLNVVLGYTDVLADEIDSQQNEDMKEHLDAIRRAGRRLNRTIQGILDFSKIEARAFELRPQAVNLAAMLERHVDDIRILAEQKKLRLRCVIDDPKGTVLFDEYCLSGALTNLLQNAIKFTEAGSVTAKLYRGADRKLKISIIDTGIGIEPGYLGRIFEPFSQEESGYTRRFEGNGLGLALTRSYLQLNGATIAVESQKGQGSTFTISFSPESELDLAEPVPANKGERNGSTPPILARRPCVLVVEDDLDNQILIRTILKKGYEVRVASSAEEARRVLESTGEQPIELILMDWSLKGEEDGVTLTRNLRMDERYKKTPMVALTAHASDEDRKLAKATGFDAFIGKPVDRDELFRTLGKLVH